MKYILFIAFMMVVPCYSNVSERELEVLTKTPEAIISEANKSIREAIEETDKIESTLVGLANIYEVTKDPNIHKQILEYNQKAFMFLLHIRRMIKLKYKAQEELEEEDEIE